MKVNKAKVALAIFLVIIGLALWGVGTTLFTLTLVSIWIPIVVAFAFCAILYPILFKPFGKLAPYDSLPVKLFLYIFVIGSIGWFGFLGGNYFLGDRSDEHIEQGVITQKYSQTRQQHRRGRSNTEITTYYLRVDLPSGQNVRYPVSTSTYVKQKVGNKMDIKVRTGAFGLQIAQFVP